MVFDPAAPEPEIPIPASRVLELLGAIQRQYRLSWLGIHGVGHWARVLDTGLRLTPVTGADPEVVSLFAIFHDACRANDGHDPRHGARGARLADSLLGSYFEGRLQLMDLLKRACTYHTDGYLDQDATVATCWDADRLDLLRVGINPSPRKLCTDAARDPGLLAWANGRARREHVPDFARDGWLHPTIRR